MSCGTTDVGRTLPDSASSYQAARGCSGLANELQELWKQCHRRLYWLTWLTDCELTLWTFGVMASHNCEYLALHASCVDFNRPAKFFFFFHLFILPALWDHIYCRLSDRSPQYSSQFDITHIWRSGSIKGILWVAHLDCIHIWIL